MSGVNELSYISSNSYSLFNLLPHEHIMKNGRFHRKASCYKFTLLSFIIIKLWKRLQYWWNLAHICCLNHKLCNNMLNLKFSVTMATYQNCEKSLVCIVFSIKTDFKVLQLLNAMKKSKRLFSVGYTSP
jgi:hypothetical protein